MSSEVSNKIPLMSGNADKTPQSTIFVLISLGLNVIVYIPLVPKSLTGNFRVYRPPKISKPTELFGLLIGVKLAESNLNTLELFDSLLAE